MLLLANASNWSRDSLLDLAPSELIANFQLAMEFKLFRVPAF